MLAKERYYSLDIFRGATVALMILVNNPGSWSHIYSPFKHAAWHGLTPTDLVFPFFLFAVGNAIAFVMPRLEAGGDVVFWKKLIRRTLLIFLIGFLLNWWPFVKWEGDQLALKTWTWITSDGELRGLRIMGILQRIALSYLLASVIIYYFKARGALLTGTLLLLLYWLLCILGNPADPYSLSGWFGTNIDRAILSETHMTRWEVVDGKPFAFEQQSLITMMTSAVNIIAGFLAGNYIRKTNEALPHQEQTSKTLRVYKILAALFMTATALMFAGYVWGLVFPVNKKIWTSSYVILTSGMALALLAMLIYQIELKNRIGRWSRFFDAFGKNPLFIFALSMLLPALLELIRIPNGMDENGATQYLSPLGWFYQRICTKVPGVPENGSLVYAISLVVFYWAIAYWMDKKRIYIKV